MDLQDPKVQRLLVSVLLSGLVLYGFFGMSYLPFSYPARDAKITTMENEYEKVSRDLERARLTVGNMEKVEREFEALQLEVQLHKRTDQAIGHATPHCVPPASAKRVTQGVDLLRKGFPRL